MAKSQYSRYYKYIKPIIENKVLRSSLPYIFSMVTITILVVFAIRPTIATISNLQKNLVDNQKVLKDLTKKEEDLTKARQNLIALGPETRIKINTLVPEQPNVTTLIASLQNSISQNATVSALQIQPVTVIDNSNLSPKARLSVGEVSFTYNSQGPFIQLFTILQNLSQTPRLIKIDTATFNKQAEGSTTLSVSGKSFFLKPNGK